MGWGGGDMCNGWISSRFKSQDGSLDRRTHTHTHSQTPVANVAQGTLRPAHVCLRQSHAPCVDTYADSLFGVNYNQEHNNILEKEARKDPIEERNPSAKTRLAREGETTKHQRHNAATGLK